MDLINKHDDPISFLASAIDAMIKGKLKLKQRGVANTRELVALWNKVKKKKIKLKEINQYITEGKNVHLTHAADLSFEGKERIAEAIAFLEALTEMLRGSSSSKLNLTRKWDGAPAIICGTDPENGKFFVGTKSVFNKENPKINYTKADIDKNHSGGLAEKLKEALQYLPKLRIKGILQGDFLFGKGDVSKKKMDGEPYLVFTPNTITYGAQEKSDLANKINRAKIGIIFHTKYTGKAMSKLKASFNVSSSDFGSSSAVWAQDAGYKDTAGKATFTEAEYKKMEKLLAKAKSAAKGAAAGSNMLKGNPKVSEQINIYTNSRVREGDYSFSAKEFTNFVNDKLEKKLSSLKTEKGRARGRLAQKKMVSFLKAKSKDIDRVFAANSTIQECVVFLVKKLQEVQSLRTFIKTSTGYRVTGDEGFVASDEIGSAVKLVDRLEFSKINFTAAKNWVKG